MKTHARLLLTLCGPLVVIVALLMLVTPATVGAPTHCSLSPSTRSRRLPLNRPSSSSTIRPGPPTPRPRSPSFPIHRSPVNPPRFACG